MTGRWRIALVGLCLAMGRSVAFAQTAPGRTVDADGDVIRDFDFFSLELNDKIVFDMQRGLRLSVGLGGGRSSTSTAKRRARCPGRRAPAPWPTSASAPRCSSTSTGGCAA